MSFGSDYSGTTEHRIANIAAETAFSSLRSWVRPGRNMFVDALYSGLFLCFVTAVSDDRRFTLQTYRSVYFVPLGAVICIAKL